MNKPIAIVTGATKGIGLAIARQLVSDGYFVVGTYVSAYDVKTIEALESEDFILKRVDSKDFEACLAFNKEVESHFGVIHVLVNNAGIVKDDLLLRMTSEQFESVIDVNLTGTFNMVKAFSKSMMRKRAGAIVNISSVIGEIGNVGQSNYAASKAGVIGFSKSIAKELAPRGIRVNCVAPGFIDTEMTGILDDTIKNSILTNVPLKTFGTGEDVAHAVSFLVSERSHYITGQVLNVCGGLVM